MWSVDDGIFEVLQNLGSSKCCTQLCWRVFTLAHNLFTVSATVFALVYLCVNVEKWLHVCYVMVRAVAFTTGYVFINVCVL